jgi:glycosyltransferase involved in cell wall biosynthesis
MIPPFISKYLHTRGIRGPWKISGNDGNNFRGIVVIPALSEKDFLFATLESLEKISPEDLHRFLILIVVNNCSDADPECRKNNEATLQILVKRNSRPNPPQISWVDAATPGLELPQKGGGVGLARKIGFDLALSQLDFKGPPPLLISLDADTLVCSDYLSAIENHFQKARAGGAVIPFCHRAGETPEQNRAIQRYELFLRTYVLGLERAGSPYAFHTVGSAMACTAEAYVRMGGMNTRQAAEDFYFLQQLAKTYGVAQIRGTVVYPSPRASNRVPFGTGMSVSRFMDNPRGVVLFYRRECFQILKEWQDLISEGLNLEGAELLVKAEEISEDLATYLRAIQFADSWRKLRKNFPTPLLFRNGFHQWFDGLKTLKLIHQLSAGPFPRGEPEQVLPDFFRWARIDSPEGIEAQLSLLRGLQIGRETGNMGSFPPIESSLITEFPI